jgi:chromosome segregation ATPase
MLYKQGYDSLTQAIKKDKILINEKNVQIENLKNEIEKLKDQSRTNMMNNNNIRSKHSSSTISEYNTNAVFAQAKKLFDKNEAIKYATNEWLNLLDNNIDIKLSELEKLSTSHSEAFGKIIDGLESLNKLIMDKNLQINFLMQENEKLNHKNSKMENKSIKQAKTILELKQQINKIKQDISDFDVANTSMVNNYLL